MMNLYDVDNMTTNIDEAIGEIIGNDEEFATIPVDIQDEILKINTANERIKILLRGSK